MTAPRVSIDKKQNMASAALKELAENSTQPAFKQEQMYASIISETLIQSAKLAKGNQSSVSFTEMRMEQFWESQKTLLQAIFDGKGGVVRNKS